MLAVQVNVGGGVGTVDFQIVAVCGGQIGLINSLGIVGSTPEVIRVTVLAVDSVPAMAVADAIILDRVVDLTVYVIRQGYMDRRELPEVEMLYRDKKFHNMCVVLNDVTYSGHKYGYYNDYDKKGFFKRRRD